MPPTPPARRRQTPTWYYAVGAAGIAVVFFLYRRNQASKAAAATPAANAYTPVPSTQAVSGQELGTLLSYITQAQGQPAQVVAAPSSTSTTGGQFATAVGNGQAGGQLLDIIGSIVAPSTYSGYNVTGGAPVYANVGGQWKLGVPASQLPVGTQLATPVASAANINTAAGVTTEPLR
jgi:hypothetical protein